MPPPLIRCSMTQARSSRLERSAGSRSDSARQQHRLSQDYRYIIPQSALAQALFQQAGLFGVKLGQAAYALPLAEEALAQAQAVSATQLAEDVQTLLEHLRPPARQV